MKAESRVRKSRLSRDTSERARNSLSQSVQTPVEEAENPARMSRPTHFHDSRFFISFTFDFLAYRKNGAGVGGIKPNWYLGTSKLVPDYRNLWSSTRCAVFKLVTLCLCPFQ